MHVDQGLQASRIQYFYPSSHSRCFLLFSALVIDNDEPRPRTWLPVWAWFLVAGKRILMRGLRPTTLPTRRPSVNLTTQVPSPKTPIPHDALTLQVHFHREPETVGRNSLLVRGSPITNTKPVSQASESACGSKTTVRINGKEHVGKRTAVKSNTGGRRMRVLDKARLQSAVSQ